MVRPSTVNVILQVFWLTYAVASLWSVYEATPLLSRHLLLILGGYGAILAVVTFIVVLRARNKRSHARSAELS